MTSQDVTEFGGWPRPPRWAWAAAGLAVVAVLAVVVVARTGAHHAAASSASRNTARSGPAQAVGACGILAPGGTVRVWHPAAGAPLHVSAPHGTSGVAFSPDGKLLGTADGDGTVWLWHPATGQPTGGVVPIPVCLPGPSPVRVP